MTAIKDKKLIVIILVSLLISNIYFFFNSRSFISTYLINTISDNEIMNSINNDEARKISNKYQKFYNPINIYERLNNQLTIELYADLLRFLQNNKSYKYKFSKQKNLTENEEKKFFSIVENINLEGAYFLNPRHLSIVKLQLFNNKKTDEKILRNYVRFIVNEELNKIQNKTNNVTINHSKEILNHKINFKRENESVLEFIDWSNFIMKNADFEKLIVYSIPDKLNFSTSDKLAQIKKDILFLSFTAKEIRERKRLNLKKIERMQSKIKNVFWFFNYEYFLKDSFSSIYEVLQKEDYYDQLFFISNNDWFIEQNVNIEFNDDNFDFLEIEKNILENFEFIDRKFNIKELIAVNIFAIVFGISLYFIFLNFRKGYN